MQPVNWNDIKYLLAVARRGRIAAAASELGVDDTTVSRRLKAFEASLQCELFARFPDGTLRPSGAGAAIIAHAEQMERAADAIRETLGAGAGKLLGTVRITAVPVIANRLLAPALKRFLAVHPDLTVELLPQAGNLSLTRREADLAIRLARPETGGTRVKARRIGSLRYGAYAPAGIEERAEDALGWIAYDDSMAHLPQARWLAALVRRGDAHLAGIRVTDAETAIEAVAGGLGMALLPIRIAQDDPRLRRVAIQDHPAPPTREIWLLSHAEQARQRAISAVKAWLEGIPWNGAG